MCALYADTIVCIHIHNSTILQEELAKERNWNVKTLLDKVKGSKRRILLSVTHNEVNSSYGECVCVCRCPPTLHTTHLLFVPRGEWEESGDMEHDLMTLKHREHTRGSCCVPCNTTDRHTFH